MSLNKDYNELCGHCNPNHWLAMQEIIDERNVLSLMFIDSNRSRVCFVPSNEFKVNFAFNEIDGSVPYDCENFEEWFSKSLKYDTIRFNIHCCSVNEIIRKLLSRNEKLRRISFHYFVLDSECFRLLIEFCPKLEAINIENSTGIDYKASLLFDKLIDLKHINLSGSDCDETTLETILNKCPKLESINVSNNDRIIGKCFGLINGNTIRRIDIRDCWRIEDKQIDLIANLKSVSMTEFIANSGINNNSLIAICENSPNLVHLNISYEQYDYVKLIMRNDLTSKGFKSIGKLKQLKTLVVKHVGVLKDNAFKDIMKGCPRLTELILYDIYRHRLTDNAFQDINKYCAKLERIESVHNHFVGPISMTSIAGLPQLKTLVLVNEDHVTDEITKVIENCAKLSFINVDGCVNVGVDVYFACIGKAKSIKKKLFTASLISTRVNYRVVKTDDLPSNLKIRVSGPENKEKFADWTGIELIKRRFDVLNAHK